MKTILIFSISLLFLGTTSFNIYEVPVQSIIKKIESTHPFKSIKSEPKANYTKSIKGQCVEVKIQYESEHHNKTWYQIQVTNSCDQKIKVTFKSKDEGKTRTYRFTVDGNEKTYWQSYPSDTGDFYDLRETDY